MTTKIKNEEWLELYSELASYVENKLFPNRKTHDDDGNRIDETSDDFCEICNDIEEILSGVLTMEDLKAPKKYPSISQKERAKHQTQWLIGVEPSEVKQSKEFLEKINKDHWNQDLWDEFSLAVQDPEDANAIKDINRLAEKFLGRSDCLRDDAKALVNGVFITVCGAGLDTLIDRSMEEEEDDE